MKHYFTIFCECLTFTSWSTCKTVTSTIIALNKLVCAYFLNCKICNNFRIFQYHYCSRETSSIITLYYKKSYMIHVISKRSIYEPLRFTLMKCISLLKVYLIISFMPLYIKKIIFYIDHSLWMELSMSFNPLGNWISVLLSWWGLLLTA